MKNNKGLTLIEVVITIAIIGIIAIPIFTIFNGGLQNIMKARERTEGVFEVQSEINKAIIDASIGEDITIEVIIPSLNIKKYVEGKKITIKKDKIKITTFIPNN